MRKEVIAGLLLLAVLSQLSFSFSQGPNNRNVSVDTTVNITGSAPEVLRVDVEGPITLSAGSITPVECNITVRDYNGFGDIDTVEGRFFSASSAVNVTPNNNTHYRNTSCSAIPGQESGSLANYTCTFPVNYYALNESWNCTGIVNDTINLRNNNTNGTLITQLLALNVTTLIDYGDMAIGDTSGNQTADIANLGNVPINVSVHGYGVTPGDGLSFDCEQGNLTVDLQRFSANVSANYSQKQALSSSLQQVSNFTIPKATNATAQNGTTYWQLYLDTLQNAFGVCNGTIMFQAEGSV